MPELNGVVAGYARSSVLHGVSLKVPERSVVGLLGPNGAGKTTVAKTISALLRCRAGSIRFTGADFQGVRPEEIVRRGVTHVPQGRMLFPELPQDREEVVHQAEVARSRQRILYASIASVPAITQPFSKFLFRGATAEVVRYAEVNTEFVTQELQASKMAIDSRNPDMKKWLAAWHKEYADRPRGRPNHYDLMAYTDMYAIAEGLRRAGRDLSTDKVIAALETLKDYRVSEIASARTFTATSHTGNRFNQAMALLSGRWMPLAWKPQHPSDNFK